MRCARVTSRLNAYVDGELSERQVPAVEAHLATCQACRGRLVELRRLEALFQDTLSVPAVPKGFAVRAMAEARRRRPSAALGDRSPLPVRRLVQWLPDLSASMRLAAGATVLLAVVAGLSLDGNSAASRNGRVEGEEDLYGLEWFGPIAPGSIGSIYLPMTAPTHDTGGGQ